MYVPICTLIIKEGNKICLGKRINTGHNDGYFSFPAGHVEVGESPKDGMVREAFEEVGIKIDPNDLKLLTVVYKQSRDEVIDFVFEVEKYEGTIQNMEPEKCGGWNFYDMDNLPLMSDGRRRLIDIIRQRQNYAEMKKG